MMTKKKLTLFTIVAAAVSIFFGIMSNKPVYAEMDPVVQKWIFAQYYNCLIDNSPELASLRTEIKTTERNGNERIADVIFKKTGGIPEYGHLPSEGYFTRVNKSALSCQEVITGADGLLTGQQISGILEAAGSTYKATWKDGSEAGEVLKKIGYKAQNEDEELTFTVVMNRVNTMERTDMLSWITGPTVTTYGPDAVSSARIEGKKGADGHVAWKVIDSNFANELKVTVDSSNRLTITYDAPNGLFSTLAGCYNVPADIKSDPIQLPDSLDESAMNGLEEKIRSAIHNWKVSYSCENTVIADTGIWISTTKDIYEDTFEIENVVNTLHGTIFTHDGTEQTALQSLVALGHGLTSLKLTDDEKLDLYTWYIQKATGMTNLDDLRCQNEYSKQDDSVFEQGLTEVHLKSGDKVYKYYIDLSGVDTTTPKYYTLEPRAEIKAISLNDIIEWLKTLPAEELTADDCENNKPNPDKTPGGSSGVDDTTVIDPSTGDTEVNCFNAAGALGWILCPVIDFAQHTITAVYNSIVSGFLEFRASFLEIRGDNAVYTAWQTFQSIANIGFVIMLLVVIFSQLTGIGIDNLGIKRILPKLIIAAVLINLSYLICMLFVDISNIFGVGLNNIFSNIIVTVDGAKLGGQTGAAVLSTVMTAVVGSAVVYLAPAAAVTVGITGAVIVLPLVLGLIATLIGVLFFFILLGVRQALIIMLIVISPVAVACYMLPNTKQFFDKWLKLFEALLLLYPLCGLIMGGSAFASDVLMTLDTGFLGKLIAMLVGVVPFFFIPTLLKNSMSLAGNIGAKISGMGQSLSRGTRQRVAGSQWAKDYQTRSAAGYKANGEKTYLGKLRSDIASGNRFSRVPGLRTMASRSQARGLMNYEKMKDEIDLASRPELIQSEAEAKRFARRQAAEDSTLVNSGVVDRTGDVSEQEFADNGAAAFEEGTLAYTAMQAARSGNVEMQYATAERMLASGHHGAEAYRQVLQALEQEGNTAAIQNFAKAGKGSRNLGELKGGARSTYDYINAVADGKVLEKNASGTLTGRINAGQTLNDYVGKTKFGNMSEAQLFNTDKEELSRYASLIASKRRAFNQAASVQFGLGYDQNDALKQTDEYKNLYNSYFNEQDRALISQAEKAFSNIRLRGNAKESSQNIVADIAGLTPEQREAIIGRSINVDHGNGQA